ncbi:MAG: aminotransferase class I/II-fold pyridoxal phosphate-dependent enzyme [Eubacteriales bacterium]|nr:aminotransferase class I/II-fold pyridoxal phosphate-dependent enzyme [Eubacteriales bacterium]
MKYDFETIVRRGENNLKYQWTPEPVREAGYASFDAAEMDFPTAPSIIRSVTEMVQEGNFGFSQMTPAYQERVVWWMAHARDWEIRPEWIVPVMGTIFSVATAIRMCTKPGEGIIVPAPGYNRYAQAASRLGRKTAVSPMKEIDGRYEMDFAELERLMAQEENKLFLLCNPHNPTGRVWTETELTELARLSSRYGVYVFSDEIFAEVTYDGRRTIPYCEIPEGREFAIVCTSLGKTFNFTGVNHANILIPDETLRERFTTQRTADHYGSLEPFAYASIMGAYTEEGLDWVKEMLQCVGENRRLATEFFARPDAPGYLFPVEGSYVGWIRWDGLELSGAALKEFLDQEALLALEIGTEFGEPYDRYTRMSLGSTVKQTELALERLKAACDRKNRR